MPLPLLVDTASGLAEPASAAFERLLCHTLDASGFAYRYLQFGLSASAGSMDGSGPCRSVDHPPAPPPRGRLRRLRQLAAIAMFGLTPSRVADANPEWTGVAHLLRSRDPGFWVASDLCNLGAAYADTFRRLLPLRAPEPLAAMQWTSPQPIRVAGIPNLYWFADLAALRLPFGGLGDSASLLRSYRQIVQEAAHILAASEACRADLRSLLGVPETKVTVVRPVPPAAPPPDPINADDVQALLARLGLEWGQYYVFPAPIGVLSNFARMQQAVFASASRLPVIATGGRTTAPWPDAGLVASSNVAWRQWAEPGCRIDASITVIDGMPPARRRAMLLGARAVLAPALYDCSGYHVLEAMMLGLPVLAAASGALPELLGSTAWLADPYDVNSLAAALHSLERSATARSEAAAIGRRRAAGFAVEASEALGGVYRRLGLPLAGGTVLPFPPRHAKPE